MPDLSKRSSQLEIMDDLECQGEVVGQTLREIDEINKRLGGNHLSVQGLESLLKNVNGEVIKVADLGCGSGEMLKLFTNWADRNNKHLECVGIDANAYIIEYARQNLKGVQNTAFKTQNILSREFTRQKFDVIHCSLFLHHFTQEELVHLFTNFKKQARIGIVINDLHRHWLAYYSIKLVTSLLSKSKMVKFDAPLSVARGFKKNDLLQILDRCGMTNFDLKWKWAFRWQIVINNK
ncbi:MAG: methyltransferase domain-containing protein [Cyclobacteriaceae bacterium]